MIANWIPFCFRFVVVLFVLSLGVGTVAADEEIDYTVKTVADDWNSLEVVRLCVNLAIPAVLFAVGVWLDRRLKEFEHRQWSNQKVIEKRLEVYEKITPGLNDMMCYFLRIGAWKENGPTQIIDLKRDIDKIAYIYAPLFSPEFLKTYNNFMSQCFVTDRGAGMDAALRTEVVRYKEAYNADEENSDDWPTEWNDCFVDHDQVNKKENVGEAYQALVGLIARELGVGIEMPPM